MPPAIIAAAVGAAGTIGGGLIASSAAKKAAKTQADSANQATALQRDIYNQNRTDQMPWHDAGVQALGQLQSFLAPGADQNALLQAQPGYQARFDQGVNAVDRSAVARGMLDSGGTRKELTRYGQTFGSNELNNILNRYSALAGIGQTSANQLGQLGQAFGQQAGQNGIAAGNAMAQGQLGSAAGLNSAFNGLTTLGQNLFSQRGPGAYANNNAGSWEPYSMGQASADGLNGLF